MIEGRGRRGMMVILGFKVWDLAQPFTDAEIEGPGDIQLDTIGRDHPH
jgi:hypothetical protein